MDINQLAPEEPVGPMAPGHCVVTAETPHVVGCHAADTFTVQG